MKFKMIASCLTAGLGLVSAGVHAEVIHGYTGPSCSVSKFRTVSVYKSFPDKLAYKYQNGTVSFESGPGIKNCVWPLTAKNWILLFNPKGALVPGPVPVKTAPFQTNWTSQNKVLAVEVRVTNSRDGKPTYYLRKAYDGSAPGAVLKGSVPHVNRSTQSIYFDLSVAATTPVAGSDVAPLPRQATFVFQK